MGTSDKRITRRRLLGALALGLGGIASLQIVPHLFDPASRRKPRDTSLPGEGSIFQPRRDARLEEWERTHGTRGS